ncbi:MAG: methylenetetrahydrofolate--tRNA-(uracil(54)-C(5))-methyltransferase (FADH(2)-oxidizing) TrmFO [Thermoanaerobaculales bacterium]|nr:methylenetetrahydrofolate--tRNA-(uracil(54)-C(5))-methyltransferase (FADH(2)-oxidizing) TrmFO [Thermoanaerobaculales bacterium]
MNENKKEDRGERPLVVGGGLAGCEAAWQLAEAGVDVVLTEMRPIRTTPVHKTADLAELVCSNSLRGDSPTNAVGLLKREMAALNSLVIQIARRTAVPAGGALAVDRELFSQEITQRIADHPRITLEHREEIDVPEGPAIIATGPLTSSRLHEAITQRLGEEALSFFDAIAPVVAGDSLDHDVLFRASRYDKGEGADYLNCPFGREEYEHFITQLLEAETTEFRDFETADLRYFEGCLPIEVMAERGRETLRFGPMKPVGLIDPRTGLRPWAVLQLRQDDLAAENWNLVGYQTKMKQGEQRRVFRQIPGFEQARFVRYGMIHRNTFINSPAHLDAGLRLRHEPGVRVAGQLTGVEGYVESAATGLIAARGLVAELRGGEVTPPPPETALGALVRHLTQRPAKDFQPSNITWGLMVCPEDLRKIRSKKERRLLHAERALASIRPWAESLSP